MRFKKQIKGDTLIIAIPERHIEIMHTLGDFNQGDDHIIEERHDGAIILHAPMLVLAKLDFAETLNEAEIGLMLLLDKIQWEYLDNCYQKIVILTGDFS